MKTANLNNYVNLLNDVYAQGSISTALCRKHRLSNSTTRTLRELKYCNMQGKSLMYVRPSVNDAKKVIAQNRKIQKNYNKEKLQTKIEFVKPKPNIKKASIKVAPIKVENSKTTEINLFWGMIKIKR